MPVQNVASLLSLSNKDQRKLHLQHYKKTFLSVIDLNTEHSLNIVHKWWPWGDHWYIRVQSSHNFKLKSNTAKGDYGRAHLTHNEEVVLFLAAPLFTASCSLPAAASRTTAPLFGDLNQRAAPLLCPTKHLHFLKCVFLYQFAMPQNTTSRALIPKTDYNSHVSNHM